MRHSVTHVSPSDIACVRTSKIEGIMVLNSLNILLNNTVFFSLWFLAIATESSWLSRQSTSSSALSWDTSLMDKCFLHQVLLWLFLKECFHDTTILKSVVVSFLEEWISIITCLNSVVVTSSWGEFQISQSTLHVTTHSNSIESTWFDSLIILIIAEGSRHCHWFLLFPFPEGELFGFTLWEGWPSFLSVINFWVLLLGITFVGGIIVHFYAFFLITCSSIVFVAMSKSARLFELDFLEFWISLYVVDVPRVFIFSKFHCKKWSAIWQILFSWLIWSMKILKQN